MGSKVQYELRRAGGFLVKSSGDDMCSERKQSFGKKVVSKQVDDLLSVNRKVENMQYQIEKNWQLELVVFFDQYCERKGRKMKIVRGAKD